MNHLYAVSAYVDGALIERIVSASSRWSAVEAYLAALPVWNILGDASVTVLD
jgi:hypothetical protein